MTLAQAQKTEQAFFMPAVGKVVRNRPITQTDALIEVEVLPSRKFGYRPGQFAEISVFGIGEAPVPICSSPTRAIHFQLCVRKAGTVTQALHDLKPGETVGIRGPLGRGFPLEKFLGKDMLLMAEERGIAALRSLVHYVLDKKTSFGKVTIVVEAERPESLLFHQEFNDWKKDPQIQLFTTVIRANSQWKGNVGHLTSIFHRIQIQPKRTIAVLIGSTGMYQGILPALLNGKIAKRRIYLALDRKMKCGIGKCGHCQVGPFYVCREGPIFCYAKIVDWEEAFNWKSV